MNIHKNISHTLFFKRSIAWHTIEAFGYHSCLVAHHILFFVVAPRELYGAIGTIFSCIYLSANFLHLGIIDTLATFFSDFSQSQIATRTFLYQQLRWNFYAFILYSIIMYIFSPRLLPSIFTLNIIFLTLLAVFFESVKKITKRLLRVTGNIPIVTGTSIISILMFMGMVWIPFYFFDQQLYVPIVLIALIFMGAFECIINSYYVYKWYQTLPKKECSLEYEVRIFSTRRNALLLDIKLILFLQSQPHITFYFAYY